LLDGANSNVYLGASGTTSALSGLVTIGSTGSFVVQNGRSFATGSSLANAGILTIGSTSTLTVTTTYTQTGTLNVQLGGTSAGQFSKLTVTGAATLGGTLAVALVNGYSPIIDTISQPISYASRTGNFATTTMPDLSAGGLKMMHYAGSTAVELHTVPLP